MNQRLRIAVIGAGVFGGYHANKCAAHPRADFVGIYDPDISRAKAHTYKHGVQAFDDFQAMLADLMTHDLDLVMMLMGALPKAVRGETRTEKSAAPDVAKGELTFENGAATLIASRLEDDFSRTMDITYPSGTVRRFA